MRTLTAHEYIADSQEALKTLKQRGLSAEQREVYDIKKRCASRVKKEMSGIGANMEVITQKDAGDQKMAGCADFDRNKMLIAEDTLADKDTGWVKHVFKHEAQHLKSGKRAFDVQKGLSSDHKAALQEPLKNDDLTVNALEGFTDIAVGEHNRSGYAKREVPFAKELEKLCKERTGNSLMEAYNDGRRDSLIMNQHVRKTADGLLCDQVVKELKDEHGYLFNFRRFRALNKRLKQNIPSVSGLDQARQVVSAMFAEL